MTQPMHPVPRLIFPCARQEDNRHNVHKNILYKVSINNSNFENEQDTNNTCTSTLYWQEQKQYTNSFNWNLLKNPFKSSQNHTDNI